MDAACIFFLQNLRTEECGIGEEKEHMKNARETKNDCNKQGDKGEIKHFFTDITN
jgi:hypothetical protein